MSIRYAQIEKGTCVYHKKVFSTKIEDVEHFAILQPLVKTHIRHIASFYALVKGCRHTLNIQ